MWYRRELVSIAKLHPKEFDKLISKQNVQYKSPPLAIEQYHLIVISDWKHILWEAAMKVIDAIFVATLIICCESIENPGLLKQRYDAAYRFQNQNANLQEFYRPQQEIRPHRYRYVQQPQQNLNEDYIQHNQYQQKGRESIRTINNHQYLNRNNNHQNVQASVHQVNQDRKIIYQAVPYPVPVPDNLPHPTRKNINNHAVDIQQSIPIYMARQIYQVTNDGALRLISEEELRNPAPDANFNQRLLPPLFMQYPILIVKHEQH